MKTWATLSLVTVALLGAGVLAAREEIPSPAKPSPVAQLNHRWPGSIGAAAPGTTVAVALESAGDPVLALRAARGALPSENPVAAADAAPRHIRFM